MHIGSGSQPALGVSFNGKNNTLAALSWVFARLPDPESVLTVGCSAGSLGATVFSRWISDRYGSARCVSLGDSYVGVMTADWWQTLDENWDLFQAIFPAPGLEPERLRDFRPDVVGYIGQMYALSDQGNFYGQFSYNADIVQTAFTAVAGGNPLAWTVDMRAIIPTFLAAPNTAAAIASGIMHCTTVLNGFFTQSVAGVPLAEWLTAMLRGTLPEDWRLLDDLASNNATALATWASSEADEEEAARMRCAAGFIAEVGTAWEGNLTQANAHLYRRLFHKACPGFPTEAV